MVSLVLPLCSCSMLLDSPDSDEGCVAPDDECEAFRCDGFDGCYVICDEMVEQPTAAAVCAGWGFSLMTIDAAGLDMCLDDVREAGTSLWIGLAQRDGASSLTAEWSWPDGSALSGYENWSTNEPNDQMGVETGIEQCVERAPTASTAAAGTTCRATATRPLPASATDGPARHRRPRPGRAHERGTG